MFRTRHECSEIYSGVKNLALFFEIPEVFVVPVFVACSLKVDFHCRVIARKFCMGVQTKYNVWKVTRKRKS